MQIVILPLDITSSDGQQKINTNVRFPWLTTAEWASFKTDFEALYGTGDVDLQLHFAIGVDNVAPELPSEAYSFIDSRINLSMCLCFGLYTLSGFVAGYNAISNFIPAIRVNNYDSVMAFPEDEVSGDTDKWRFLYYNTKYGPLTTHQPSVIDYTDVSHAFLRVSGFLGPVAMYGHTSGYPDDTEHYSCYIYMPVIVSDASNLSFISESDIRVMAFTTTPDGYKTLRTSLSMLESRAPEIYNAGLAELITKSDVKTFVAGDTTDPYDQGGNSGGGGGTGTFDDSSDVIHAPAPPDFNVADSGMVTLFNPSKTQLRALSDYLWSDAFDINAVKKMFADPMDAIIGLSLVPVAIPNGAVKPVRVAGVSTGISMTVADKQLVTVDCGSLKIDEFFGTYLDYDPYTKFDLYLPYIGIHSVSADDIMGKTVHVIYNVDILTGACIAFVEVDGCVLYSYTGQCSIEIPVTGSSWSNAIMGAITIAGSIGKMAATGGASAPTDLTAIANAAVNQLKPSIEKSGSMSGGSGLMAVRRPYLIRTRPRQAKPENQNTFTGYPSNITEKLGDLTGFTIVDRIHLNNIPCTDTERDEILSLLKTGVIF